MRVGGVEISCQLSRLGFFSMGWIHCQRAVFFYSFVMHVYIEFICSKYW